MEHGTDRLLDLEKLKESSHFYLRNWSNECRNWENFAEKTNYHFDIKENLLDTYIGKYPRRSIDAYVKSQLEGNWNCIPWEINPNMTFDELAGFVMPLLKQEEIGSIDVLNIHSMR